MPRFVFYNNNPELLIEKDCVCRAISFATGLEYNKVEEKLKITAKLYECEELSVCCYQNYINFVLKAKYINDAYGMSIGEFSDKFNNGIYLVRAKGHLSVVYNGTIIDIFDCSDMIITDCWQI